MGLCRKDFGKVSIESRRESFYIHHDPGEGDALEKLWKEYPHPEIGYENLEDLIKALEDLRDNDDSFKKWKGE